MNVEDIATRYLFFTGKGGVGKTSVACAVAIALADRGRRVLLVSTDPASNLDEVLGVGLGSRPRAVPGVARLEAMNLDPELAASEYREKMVGPYRGVLPEATVRSMEEQLSGSCTMEIAAFDEFSRLLGDPERTAGFDHVVFDTAPTGHTLRLLSLPAAWSSFLEANATGTSCLGPLASLKDRHELYVASVAALADRERTTLVLVGRPEVSALREAERSSAELRELGLCNQCLVLNGVFRSARAGDEVAVAFETRGREALASMPDGLAALPRREVRLSPRALLGVEALRTMLDDDGASDEARPAVASATRQELPPPLVRLVDELERPGKGVVMTMGKGGVGKTTLAAAIALELARRGHPVHLSTTDPAAHLSWLVDDPPLRLEVGRIDPERETRAYRAQVAEAVGAQLDERGRALLDEDLRSPCTEEVAVFRAFARTVAEGEDRFVVLDTAPTGHTILLLDAAEAYHREVLRQSSDMPDAVRELLPRLRDPELTRVLLVTLAEATPVHEAARLQADLARAGIRPFAWIVNQALTPVETAEPVLASRRANERPYLDEVAGRLAARVALVPWLPAPPVGAEGLRAVLEGGAPERWLRPPGGRRARVGRRFAGHGLLVDGLVFLSPREAQPFLEDDAILVDLRSGQGKSGREFEAKTVVSIPYAELESRAETLPRDRPLILADYVGLRSKEGARLLVARGYESVAALNGGIVAWVEAGMPTAVDPGEQLTGQCACQLKPGRAFRSRSGC